MKTELTYLQEELSKLNPTTLITVETLLLLIEKAWENQEKDEQNIINSMDDWHNM